MSDMKLHFVGTVDKGILHLSNRKDFDRALQGFEGKRIEGYIWRQRKRKSAFQNAYLWGLVYPVLLAGFKDAGHEDIDIDMIHRWAKERFIDKEGFEIASPISGEMISLRKSTKKMTTTEMMGYIAALQKFGAEFLGVNIPDPDPLWNLTESI